jgi:hypothetical protein
VFLDGTGAPMGYLQPALRAPSSLDRALEEFLDRADWPEHYGNFLRAERMRAITTWQRTRPASGKPLEETKLAELVRRCLYHGTEVTDFGHEDNLIRAAIDALVVEHLRKAGLRCVYQAFGGELDLAGDLGRLLGLALSLELGGLGTAVRADAGSRFLIFQAFGAQLAERCVGVLGRLHRRLRQIASEWP